MTTKEAFKQLTSIRGWYKLCSIEASTARSFKSHFKGGKVSIEKMEELLKKAGRKKKPEFWSIQ